MRDSRNLGIDLLRIVSMALIVLRHILGFGGILENVSLFSLNYGIAWLLDTAAECAVNCYALITGYIYTNAKFKYSNIVSIWLQVLFYTAGIAGLFFIFMPQSVSTKIILFSFFPVMGNHYWYFTCYFGMFFFIPFFNQLLDTCSPLLSKKLFFTIVILFSILPTIRHTDLFGAADGYSFLWLSLMYLLGGLIRRNQENIKAEKRTLLFVYLFCILSAWISKWGIQFITLGLTGTPNNGTLLLLYTSPTMLFAACTLLILFSGLKIRHMQKCILFFAPLTFGVYLIHNNNLIRENLLKNACISFACASPAVMLGIVTALTLSVFFSCSIIDLFRIYLFRLLRIPKLTQWMEQHYFVRNL
ncbi:acyltransferase [Candidatus Merdisoma sp. JLR.KK011]|uniref:acyltransferase n=1 Tax=Candidatus Merdisoma sp. JLR.KK011 TaxID=3114299 RepID=UPI002FEF4950